MLDQHLNAKTAPRANEENVIRFGHCRLTLLEDRLFRLEYSEAERFRDDATTVVWYRDMPPVPHTTRQRRGTLIVDTGAIQIVLAEKREDCFLILDGKRRKIENARNLRGTCRTLDCCDGGMQTIFWGEPDHSPTPVEPEAGVCSESGVALFDDAASPTLGEDGLCRAAYGGETDEYVFAYGHNYRDAVRALFRITGSPPMLPRYALGNWWSCYHAYSDRSYLQMLNRFADHRVPLTVATLDMDWHESDDDKMQKKYHLDGLDKEEYIGEKPGWTGYTWNKDLFPDHRRFLRQLKERGLKITLNLHPADGFRFWEDCYETMARATGVDPASKKRVKFRITDPNFINHYFADVHRPLEEEGIDFWWIDWQQGSETEIPGLDPLWALNHYHYLDNANGHEAPLTLSRYSGIGSHRYPIGFSGDTLITWDTLRYLPYFTATATNIGYTRWSHDIGGHMYGVCDWELYLRHIQYGVFSPINRLHSCDTPAISKEPWFHKNGTGEIACAFLRLRHAMIPYLYTAESLTSRDGIALTEPLYYRYDQKEAYHYQNEYFFGSEMLVCPVTDPVRADGYARVGAWIPEGTWFDFFTGDEYTAPAGGKKATFLRTMDSIPVLIPAGGVIPLSGDEGNGSDNPRLLQVAVFAGNRSYSLYEDGRQNGTEGSLETRFENRCETKGGITRQILTIHAVGDAAVLPHGREMQVEFRTIPAGTMTVTEDGMPVAVDDAYRDCLIARFPFDSAKTYVVTAEYPTPTEIEKLIARAKVVLTSAEEKIPVKVAFFKALKTAENRSQYAQIIQESALKPADKARLTEIL